MAQSGSPWWKLPPEIRNAILALAYAPEFDFKLLTRPQFEVKSRNDRKDLSKGQQVPYREKWPGSCITHFLVSKAWAKEALDVFFTETHFDLVDPLAALAVFSPSLPERRFLGAEHIRSLSLDWEILMDYLLKELVQRCPRLKRLHLSVNRDYIFDEEYRPPFTELWKDEWKPEEAVDWFDRSPMGKIFGLQDFTMSMEPECPYDNGYLDSRFLVVEVILRERLMRPSMDVR